MNRIARSILPRVATCVATRTLITSSVVPAVAVPMGSRGFAKAIKEKKPSLRTILCEELLHEEGEEQQDQDYVDIVKQIEKDWKIEVTKGSAIARLSRTFGDEQISIKFDVQDRNDDVPQNEDEEENDEDTDEEEDEEEEVVNFGIDFEVTIKKGQAKIVTHCTALETDVEFNSIRHLPVTADHENDVEHYGGPLLQDLDDSLQTALVAFFNKRGVNKDMAYFVMAYSRKKEQDEYMNWLAGLRDFVSETD